MQDETVSGVHHHRSQNCYRFCPSSFVFRSSIPATHYAIEIELDANYHNAALFLHSTTSDYNPAQETFQLIAL